MEANDKRRAGAVGRDRQPVGLAQPLQVTRRRPTTALLLRGRCGPRLPRRRSPDDFTARVVLQAGRGSGGSHSATAAAEQTTSTPFPAVFQPSQHEPTRARTSGLPHRCACYNSCIDSCSFAAVRFSLTTGVKEKPAAFTTPEAYPVDCDAAPVTISVPYIFIFYLKPRIVNVTILPHKPKN